jgi:N-methylhydantoinase B
VLEMPGGGGMGDPKTRDRGLVARDVRDGLITVDEAREVYGYEA